MIHLLEVKQKTFGTAGRVFRLSASVSGCLTCTPPPQPNPNPSSPMDTAEQIGHVAAVGSRLACEMRLKSREVLSLRRSFLV